MGDDPPYGPGPEDFPEQGRPLYHHKKSVAASGRRLGVTPLGGGDGGGNIGGWFVGGVGVCLEEE